MQETFGVACIEAMACGKPVFATRSGGVEDFVNDKCGRLVAIKDSHGLAFFINDFMNGKYTFDPVYIRDYAVSRFGKDAFVQRLTRIFCGVLNEYSKTENKNDPEKND